VGTQPIGEEYKANMMGLLQYLMVSIFEGSIASKE
jgi:hypothetical protein